MAWQARPAGVSGTYSAGDEKREYGVGYGAGWTDAGGISNDRLSDRFRHPLHDPNNVLTFKMHHRRH